PGTCYDGSDGEAEVVVDATTGTAPYNYQWFYDASLSTPVAAATTSILTGVPAGTYYILVTDANMCIVSGSVTITQPAQITGSTAITSPVSCNGESDAEIEITASGGSGTLQYDLNGANAWQGSNIFTGLGAGSYTLRVRDANAMSCVVSLPDVVISEPDVISVTAAFSWSNEGSHNINCFGGSNGSIQLTVSGGTAPYVYAWTTADGSGLNAADNGAQTGLTAGTYDVTITDNNGCTFTGSYTLTEPPALSVTVTADDYIIGNCPTSEALLTGVATGGVELSGGGYIYSWSPAGGLGDPASDITTAKPSSTVTYTLTVTDANGCTASDNLQIEVRPSLTAVASADDNIIGTCPLSVANLDVIVSGGEELGGGGYSYSWSPVAGLDDPLSKTPEAKPVVTTTYIVTVTDANGCQTTSSVTITVAPDLAVTATVDDPLIGECAGSTARLDATVTGGEGAFTYLWDNAATLDDPTLRNPVAKPLVPTTYTVTVTDANGCTATNSVFVDVAPPLTATASTDDDILSTCPASVANMDVTVNGGEGPFTYSWSPTAGLSDPFRSDPVAKPAATTTYTVTVTDANGCQATDDILITVQPPLTATATADDYIISTCPTSVAVLDAAVSGGEPGYTYLWDNDATLDDPTSATPVAKPASTTIYTVTVTDVNGCETIASVTIIVQPDLVATATADDYNIGTCPGSDATLNVTAFGGEQLGGGGYAYSWSPAATLDDATSKNPVAKPLVTTTYTVTVTDLNGCTTTASVTINVADPLAVTATASDNLIGTCPTSTSTLMATITGGEGGFTYVWDNAATLDDPNKINPVAKPAVSTTYIVTVTDANGCMATGSVTVNVAPDLTATALADDEILSTCPSSVANLDVTVNGGEPGYTYRWSPTTGLDDPYIQTPVAKPAATTTYTVQVTDANGCITTSQIVITVQPPLTATVTADDYII
ncbi:MAG: SprB repeat-containing protein, partial [Actinobacteria bacterium]|nr:SprB repeat-containing protein [Actinomycetota bacterium]